MDSALNLWQTGKINAQQAADLFRAALPQIQPNPKWLRTTSRALLDAKQVEQALLHAQQAVLLGPLEYDNHWQQAQCLIAKKDFAGAEKVLIAGEQLLNAGAALSEYAYTHHHIHSHILEKSGRLEEAVEAEQRSLQKHPNYFHSLYHLACLLIELERYLEAMPILDRALRVAGPHEQHVKANIDTVKGLMASESTRAENGSGGNPAAKKMLGYSHNNGGLTNQKFALLGLITDAYTKKLPIFLPQMTIIDNVANTTTQVPIGEVFDLGLLFELFAKYRITAIEGSAASLPADPMGSYFNKGATKCGQFILGEMPDPVLNHLVADYFRCLVPRLKNAYIMKHLIEDIFVRNAIEVVAQFRIEADWDRHCGITLDALLTEPEDYHLAFDQIAAKIARTLPDVKKILVLCDEAAVAMPKSQMADICRTRFGVELFWKSDFLTGFELAKLNNLELSMIDFELALRGKHYVGITRSTFSNAVTMTKYIVTGKPVTGDYIYNNTDLRLARRTDNGGSLSIRSREQSGSIEQVL